MYNEASDSKGLFMYNEASDSKGLFMYNEASDSKGLFMYNEASEYYIYISNLHTRHPSRYSNSRNYHLRLHLTCTHTIHHAIPAVGTITLVCLGQR